MKFIAKHLVITVAVAGLCACSSKPSQHPVVKPTHKTIVTQQRNGAGKQQPTALTLEKIMSDPDWIGRQPQSPYWGDDSQTLYYGRKQQGSVLTDLWLANADQPGNGDKVPLAQLHLHSYQNRVVNAAGDTAAWEFEGNLLVKDLHKQRVRQLSQDGAGLSHLQFLADGRLSYQQGNAVYAISLQDGVRQKLLGWQFAKAPKANEPAKDYIAQQQQQLIGYIATQRRQREARFARKQRLQNDNASLAVADFYFEPKQQLEEVSLSPNGRWALLVTTKQQSSRSDNDIMPHYIQQDGRIKAVSVRQRVADAKPIAHQLWLLDLKSQTKSKLSYRALPGYNEDVLAAVKQENAQAKGEEYQSNRLPRDIHLMQDWYWSQSAIQWHHKGNQVAVMLEAWDNKDRWIATVDFTEKKLRPQHRLHDEAWINYKLNSFGWFHQTETLYYLSEQSGYANLYRKVPGGKEQALISGNFEVDKLTLSKDDSRFYFKANINHPGIYDIFRLDMASQAITQLTKLEGMTDYLLSPDESKLLLTHSKLTRPPELYVQELDGKMQPLKLTDTVSQAFLSYNWVAPDIVAVDSSYVDQPIYARVYLPENVQQGDKRRAVIFNHGAGYLQNSHLGWSGYFREFMFHNLLTQQGYVVMDMDYRASAGYGRDWRTAIYRQMGTPEIQDLADGVNWLVANANVDRQRVGTYGGSYGGFMTFMALFTAPELFQAGAALRPVSDWAHYNHGYTSNILNMPDIDPIAYQRSSPIYFAQGLQHPLLINAPMVDNNVFFVDVVRLVQRLIELEKQDFETAIYPVEPHGFVQPSSWLDEYRRIYKLFEQQL